MAQRLGAGKLRSSGCGYSEKLATKRVPTDSNIADIGTKVLTSDRMWELMNLTGHEIGVQVWSVLHKLPMEKITGRRFLRP